MSHILKFVDFTKIQKSRYLENETLFFLQIKKSLITHQWVLYGKNAFVAEVTFDIGCCSIPTKAHDFHASGNLMHLGSFGSGEGGVYWVMGT